MFNIKTKNIIVLFSLVKNSKMKVIKINNDVSNQLIKSIIKIIFIFVIKYKKLLKNQKRGSNINEK